MAFAFLLGLLARLQLPRPKPFIAALGPAQALWLLSLFAAFYRRNVDASLLVRECVPPLRGADLERLAGQLGLAATLEVLVRKLGSQSLFVPPEARAAYHAASHYGAAFVCVLLDQGMKILAAGGMKDDVSRGALLALARSTLDAIEKSDPAHAMAGVYARGDAGTARRHVEALDAIRPPVATLYRDLARHSIALAEQANRIDRPVADALRSVLGDGEKSPGPPTES